MAASRASSRQGVATIVVVGSRTAFGEAFGGTGVVTGLIQRHRLPAPVGKALGGFAGCSASSRRWPCWSRRSQRSSNSNALAGWAATAAMADRTASRDGQPARPAGARAAAANSLGRARPPGGSLRRRAAVCRLGPAAQRREVFIAEACLTVAPAERLRSAAARRCPAADQDRAVRILRKLPPPAIGAPCSVPTPSISSRSPCPCSRWQWRCARAGPDCCRSAAGAPEAV